MKLPTPVEPLYLFDEPRGQRLCSRTDGGSVAIVSQTLRMYCIWGVWVWNEQIMWPRDTITGTVLLCTEFIRHGDNSNFPGNIYAMSCDESDSWGGVYEDLTLTSIFWKIFSFRWIKRYSHSTGAHSLRDHNTVLCSNIFMSPRTEVVNLALSIHFTLLWALTHYT